MCVCGVGDMGRHMHTLRLKTSAAAGRSDIVATGLQDWW